MFGSAAGADQCTPDFRFYFKQLLFSGSPFFRVLPSECGLLHLWWISDSDLLFSEFQYLRCRARIPLPHQACSASVFPSSSAAWRLWFLLHFAAAVTPPAGGTVPRAITIWLFQRGIVSCIAVWILSARSLSLF